MKRQHIAGIYASPESFGGQTLTVCGWARTIRDMKNFGFIELNDGSCFKSLQVVLERGKLENYDDIARQNVGAAFIVHGELVLTPDAKQPFELKADSITLEGASAPDYPLQKKRHSVEFLRTIQHLRPRTNLFSATFRVRSVAAQAVHTFFQERGFVYVQTPIITGSDCEGAGEMFRVPTLDLDLCCLDLERLLGLGRQHDGAVHDERGAHVLRGDLLIIRKRIRIHHDLQIAEARAVVQLDESEGLHIADGLRPAAYGDACAAVLLFVGEERGNSHSFHNNFPSFCGFSRDNRGIICHFPCKFKPRFVLTFDKLYVMMQSYLKR